MNDIFLFNPTGELAIANGTNSYTPPKRLRTFEEDLAVITSFFAEENDYILTKYFDDPDYLKIWNELGLPDLNYINLKNITLVPSINYLRPWSWNQVSHTRFKNVKSKCSQSFKDSPNFTWSSDHKLFFSRKTTNFVQSLISQDKSSSYITIEEPAICINNYDDFCIWLDKNPQAILKMPWSSSGRGIYVIDKLHDKPCNGDWVKGALKQQGFITAEPLLNKKQDFAFQFQINCDGKITFRGMSYFINDEKGHFIGGNIHKTQKRQKIDTFLTSSVIEKTVETLIKALEKINAHRYYEGPFGIDAISYVNSNNEVKIHPCVDINWRYNMGIVNITLPKYVKESSSGQWKISSFMENEWNSFIKAKQKQNPLLIRNNKIVSGFMNMTPSNPKARFGAWLEVL